MLRFWLAMAVGAATLIASGVVATMAGAQTGGDPAAVITAYEMARNRRDVDAALSYFADEATISQRTTTYSGKEEIRRFLDGVSTRSRFIVVSDRKTNGSRVSWTERSGGPVTGQPQGQVPAPQGPSAGASSATNVTTSGFAVTVEALVQDGKIRSLSYMAANQAARPDPALEGRAQLPAAVGLASVAVVFGGVIAFASMGLRRHSSASTLHGRLMQDLRGWTAARQ
jgi:hypothetical protein